MKPIFKLSFLIACCLCCSYAKAQVKDSKDVEEKEEFIEIHRNTLEFLDQYPAGNSEMISVSQFIGSSYSGYACKKDSENSILNKYKLDPNVEKMVLVDSLIKEPDQSALDFLILHLSENKIITKYLGIEGEEAGKTVFKIYQLNYYSD